jgi:hypothetical protein
LNDLEPAEDRLVGRWLPDDGRIVADATCRRIEWLIKNRLQRIAVDSTGWDMLYRDPRDGRLWEHSYADSGSHGGGPPCLQVISPDIARAKYGSW